MDFGRSPVYVARTSYRENFDHLSRNSCPPTPSDDLAGPLSMEAFHLLSRGGIKFDKQKYRDDVKLFNVSSVFSISQ